ncbi:hypothetical protein [Psychromonas aquimarina]|uniref:hypothetical protein n=1 Tax=Psychromonas aquimarina TaxID=444919 RepID=UPI00048C1F22|nr:hypothetical protein [Psychromonas aquimarina]
MWDWLFNRKKRYFDRDFEINFLKIILLNLEDSEKSDCKDLIAQVEKIKSDYESSGVIDMTEMMNLLSQPSTLKDIAVANGWDDQYIHIDKYFVARNSGLFDKAKYC